MSDLEQEEEKNKVYRAAMMLIEMRGLESFIDYLQQVEETDTVPASTSLDIDAYLQVLRKAISDYRNTLFKR